MSEKLNLESLSTKDISALYGKTREAVIKQRSAQQSQRRAQEDLGFGENHYKDQFGNIVEGVKTPTQEYRHYVDNDGYVRDLAPGETAPDNLLPPGASGAERLTHFLNGHLEDQEIAALLPQEEHVVIARFRDYEICGRFKDNEWHIRAIDTVADEPEIRFRMSGSYDQDQAAVHAQNYIENQLAIRPRELSQADINFIQRLAPSNREFAVGLFLKSCLPERYEQELNRLLADMEATGSNLELLRFMSEPDISSIGEDAVFNVWVWSCPGIEFTQELQDFVEQRTATTVVTFAVLDKLYSEYKFGRAVALTTAPPPVTEQQLNGLSDDQVSDLYNKTRVEFARSRR